MNIEKHAQATEVKAMLSFEEGCLRCTIADNGVGFSPSEARSEAEAETRFGLLGMEQRAEAVGGQLRVNSAPGEGTEIVFTAPLQGAPSAITEGRGDG